MAVGADGGSAVQELLLPRHRRQPVIQDPSGRETSVWSSSNREEPLMTVRIILAIVHLLALGIGLGAVWGRAKALDASTLETLTQRLG